MKRFLSILSLIIAVTGQLMAQDRVAAGTVLCADDDSPAIGATVRVKDTNIATATDVDGKFQLKGIPAKAKQLVVSYVGYETKTVDIKPEQTIYLTAGSEMLQEVIAVAFGKQKREAFTGSASVLNAADIERQQVTNPLDALNGRVTGLQMTETNSFQTTPDIKIRGVTTLSTASGANSPLIVLDGMPFNGNMNDINPADIENMTVLKDAASNALYGARGANGVILITTKKANKGNFKVNAEAKWGVNTDGRINYDYIDNAGEYYEAQYLAMRNYYQYRQGMTRENAHIAANNVLPQANTNGGLGYIVYSVPKGQFLIGENGKLNPSATLGNRVSYNNHIYTLYPDDWTKEGLRNGFRQEYNVTMTGGNEKMGMLATIGYLENDGISYNTDIKRLNARMKIQYEPFDFLRFGMTGAHSHSDSNSHEGVFGVMYSVAPIYPLYLRDGEGDFLYDQNGRRYDYGNNDCGIIRPVLVGNNTIQADMLNKYNRNTNTLNMQGFGTWDITKDLHLTINGSIYSTECRWNTTTNPYYGFNVSTGGYTYVQHTRDYDINTQQLLNYSRNFNGHSVDVLLGHEYSRESYSALNASKRKIAIYEENTELNGAIVNGDMASYKTLYNVEGYFIRGLYDYESKYFFSASYRRDGSSRFHPDHRWGNFWSVGGAWIMTKEEWWPKSDLVNMLKFKVSYGEQGNDRIGNFRYTDMYTIRNSNDNVAYVFNSKGNPKISWETVGSFNTGFEFQLFNNRLNGSVEYYDRTTRDMLQFFSAPYTIGYSGYYDNIGDMSNKGIELELASKLVETKNFSWDLNLNLSWQKNKITYLPEDKKGLVMDGIGGYYDTYCFFGEGLSINTWRLKKYAGVNEEGKALYYMTTTDADGNKSITTTTNADDGTYYLCGNAMPDVFGGFSTTITFYGFDLSAQFNYSIGGLKLDSGYQSLMTNSYSGHTGSGIHRDLLNAWTPENAQSNIPMFAYNDQSANFICDRFLTNASYLTFRNAQLGYTFSKSVIKPLHLSKLRLYAVCENIWYWTKRKGFDPRQSALYGASGSTIPALRTISGGVQINF